MDINITEIWMTIIGVSMAASGLPQIIRLLKRKTSDDISLIFFLIIIHGQFWWLWYGFAKSSLSIVLSNSIGILSTSFIIILVLKYRSSKINE